MDGKPWDVSLLGPARSRDRGPALRSHRIAARAHVGRRLREWRAQHGLTQRQAHEKLSLSGPPSRVHALEAGELPWSGHDVQQVADALGVEVSELVREAVHGTDPAAVQRRRSFVAWAMTLPEGVWEGVIDEVQRRRADAK